jgi:acyl carrier protein
VKFEADEIDRALKTIFETKLKVKNYNDDVSMDNVDNWDSLAHIGLILEIERQCSLKITASEAVRMVSVRAIKAILAGR